MLWSQFIGGAYRTRSLNLAADQLINLYVEFIDSEGAKKSALLGTPGLNILLTLGSAGCRGLFSQDGRTFGVVGGLLYEIDVPNASATSIGAIVDDGLPVSMASNGRGGEQLAIVGGGQLKILTLTTTTLSAAVALPLTNAPTLVEFLNGYFILQEADSIRRWFSTLENGLVWDALDFFATSQTSDNGVGMLVLRDRLWCFNSQNSSIFYDSGDADNPFIPYPGSVMHEGATSPYAMTALGETVSWLSQDNQGSRRIVLAADANPEVISTPAVEYALTQMARVDDAETLAYEQEGHSFLCYTFPSGDQTWVYDTTTKEWHQRAGWDEQTATFHRWRARGICCADQTLVTGDATTGELYTLDLNVFTDACHVLRRVRRAPYLSAENQWLFLDRIEMGLESGVGLSTGQGSDPKIMLSISRDSAHTFGPVVTASMGAMGAYLARAIWRRCGRVRADRFVLEMSQTEPVRAAWGPGLWLKATPGSGQL